MRAPVRKLSASCRIFMRTERECQRINELRRGLSATSSQSHWMGSLEEQPSTGVLEEGTDRNAGAEFESMKQETLFKFDRRFVAFPMILPFFLGLEGNASASVMAPVMEISEGLETPVQLIYLLTLLGFLVVGAFLVVRQVLIKRELEEAAKVLGDRVRSGQATSEDQFELGVILLRKKLFTQARKSLETALKGWEGEEEELAQVHNALGYAYFNLNKYEKAVDEYREAVRLQPGYVTAWNNLGDALENMKDYRSALEAYEEALAYAPDNKIAKSRAEFCRTRAQRTEGINTR